MFKKKGKEIIGIICFYWLAALLRLLKYAITIMSNDWKGLNHIYHNLLDDIKLSTKLLFHSDDIGKLTQKL